MLSPLLLGLGLITAGIDGPTADERAAYQAARAEAGRDADAQVRLALWCEQHGMTAQRLQHLALALLAEPAHPTARGLMGLVRDADSWRKPDEVADRIKADAERAAALADYNARRERAKMTADDQLALAKWCEDRGLEPEAKAHLTAVVRLDPARSAAWRKLGCRRYKGRWMTDDQIAASLADAEAQEKADRAWGRRLSDLKERLGRGAEQADAEAELANVSDPRAVPAVWRAFVESKNPDQARAVQVLAQIDAQAASKALAALALFGQTPEVRRVATETLVWRDPREFLQLLIGQVRKPLKYEVRPIGPGQAGELFVEGVRYNIHRTYQAPTLPRNGTPADYFDVTVVGNPAISRAMMRRTFGPPATAADLAVGQVFQQAAANPANALNILSNPGGVGAGLNSFEAQQAKIDVLQAARDEQILQRAEANVARNVAALQNAAVQAQARLARDVAEVEATNDAYHQLNRRVLPVLDAVTGRGIGPDPEAWATWWADEQGYVYDSTTRKPTFEQTIAAPTPDLTSLRPVPVHSACFAAGTPVHTLDGPRPIESVQLGDRVLAQDPETGKLEFLPVVGVFHNPPNETLRIQLGGETIVATGIHRFWVAGRGWVMARELKPGDTIRTLGGLASVDAIEADRVQPVFNLEVPGSHDYFVGKTGYLVHDYSLIQPVDHPFDAAPTLASE